MEATKEKRYYLPIKWKLRLSDRHSGGLQSNPRTRFASDWKEQWGFFRDLTNSGCFEPTISCPMDFDP